VTRPVALACAIFGWALAAAAAPLRFSVPEGRLDNEFFREGAIAAHVVLRSGASPRLVVAFPAGNSGVALWAEAPDALAWGRVERLRGAELRQKDGGLLRGVSGTLNATGGTIVIRQALIGSVRTLRDFEHSGIVPGGVEVVPRRAGRSLVWQRQRLDGGPGYFLAVEVLQGAIGGGGDRPYVLDPAPGGSIRLRFTALTGDPPLAPLGSGELLKPAAAADEQLRQVLEFLSYRDKLLAGSWRFNTYFCRDTLMSLCLLAPVLRPGLAEAGLASVLARLSPAGEVAHEEDIGEYAILRRIETRQPVTDAPIYDYKMIDDDYMLAIAAARYLLDDEDGRRRAPAFLARSAQAAGRNGSALVRNLRFVVASAAPFARAPEWRHLVALKPGQVAGNWRDSEAGLGHGRFPYDVNGILVPAALLAIARLQDSGLLDPYLDEQAAADLQPAGHMAATWRRNAAPLFDVDVTPAQAHAAVAGYARDIGIDPSPAAQALGSEGLRFRALALDADGRPVPVLNSDEAYALFLLDPEPAEVGRIAAVLARPFPAGLMTGAGLLVANPAFGPRGLQQEFGRNRYHGTVVWSWHQAMLRAGLERQLARRDLPGPVRDRLRSAHDRLHAVMQASPALRGSELWSWSWSQGRFAAVPFGQGRADETESNAAQLWSTVHLAWPDG
jgi:hypothetical protein